MGGLPLWGPCVLYFNIKSKSSVTFLAGGEGSGSGGPVDLLHCSYLLQFPQYNDNSDPHLDNPYKRDQILFIVIVNYYHYYCYH